MTDYKEAAIRAIEAAEEVDSDVFREWHAQRALVYAVLAVAEKIESILELYEMRGQK